MEKMNEMMAEVPGEPLLEPGNVVKPSNPKETCVA